MSRRVILRADGSRKIGFGHLYRLISLAQRLHTSFDCTFVSHNNLDFLTRELARLENVRFVEVKELDYPHPDHRRQGDEVPFDMADLVTGSEVVVLDGYWFGKHYQQSIRKIGCKLVCVDDLAEIDFVADVVINHSPGINRDEYRLESYTRFYSGLQYLLIRKAFYDVPIFCGNRNKGVFISMGGIDSGSLSSMLVSQIISLDNHVQLHVLYSSSYNTENISLLRQFASSHPNRVFLYHGLCVEELITVMDYCTHAITAISSVCFEVILRGIKPLGIVTAENQKKGRGGLLQHGMIYSPAVTLSASGMKSYIEAEHHLRPMVIDNQLCNIFKQLYEGY